MKLSDQYSEAPVEHAESLSAGVEATELIVHGVGGAMPSDLLDDHHPTRVSGDHLAGFYRPHTGPVRALGDDFRLSPEHYPREAFAWGGLTSGDSSRALWFLLLPFALMNMAGWMLPTMSHKAWVVVRGLARMLAALGTVTLVMMSAQLTTDIVAYQCGWLNPSCRTRWWLTFLQGEFWSAYPSRIMVLAAAIPLLILAGVWAAGLISFRNFEEYVRRRHQDTDRQTELERQAELRRQAELERTAGDYDIKLEHPWFWRGRASVHRMRRLHFQLGVVTIAVVVCLSLAELTTAAWPWQAYLVTWVGTVEIVVLLATVSLPRVETSGPVGWLDGPIFRRGCWLVAWVLLAITAGYGLGAIGKMTSRAGAYPRLEGFIPTSTILTSLQLLLGVLLAIAVWKAGRGSFLRVAPAVVHALGWFMIMALWAGIGIRLSSWFGVGQADSARFWLNEPSTCTYGDFCYPIWFEDAAVAVTLLLFVTLLIGGYALFRSSKEPDLGLVRQDFPLDADEEPNDIDRRRLKSIAGRLRHQRLVAKADRWMAAVIIGALVVFLVVAVAQAQGWRFWSSLVTLSGWVVTLVPIATVIAVRAGLNNPKTRRAIGSVFDVVTFFPRRVHPFAPPCYGERAVPQLRWRLGWLAKDEDRDIDVLVRSHSQGTVVTAAAILQGVDHPERVWVLTCGSPLVALYERHFPYYFGGIVDRVAAALSLEPGTDDMRWLHITARTDVLGAPLRCGAGAPPTQIRVLDPVSWGNQRPGDPAPRVMGHSCYHEHPVVERWVAHQLVLACHQPSPGPGEALPPDCP